MLGEERDLDVVRGMYARWAEGDFSSVDEFTEDVVWIPRDSILEGEYHGLERMTATWKDFLQAFSEGFRIEATEIVPGAEGKYLAMQTFHGVGRTSGVETTGETALVITMRDGKIARMEGFWDLEEARRVAGLS